MERRKRLQEIQEKLRQQAAELRAQREKEMMDTLEQLKNSALKSLLDGLFLQIYVLVASLFSGRQCLDYRLLFVQFTKIILSELLV